MGYQAGHLKGQQGADATTRHVVQLFPFLASYSHEYTGYICPEHSTNHMAEKLIIQVLSKWKERSHSSGALYGFRSQMSAQASVQGIPTTYSSFTGGKTSACYSNTPHLPKISSQLKVGQMIYLILACVLVLSLYVFTNTVLLSLFYQPEDRSLLIALSLSG